MPFQFRKEAIEEDLNSNFPSQGQGNPPLYYSLSEVVVPTYSINNVAEGTSLPESLQQAWDFSTGSGDVTNGSLQIINGTGFWRVHGTVVLDPEPAGNRVGALFIDNGLSTKTIFQFKEDLLGAAGSGISVPFDFIVFLKSGESLNLFASSECNVSSSYRQIATVNGTLVNPLGFSFA